MRILLVEDNLQLAEWLGRALRQRRYTVDCVHDGDSADNVLRTQPYDAVVLDLSLPRMCGRDVLHHLRERRNGVPVLILTATATLESRVGTLNSGADDYLIKPFEIDELEARLRAMMRRVSQQKDPLLRCGDLSYDSNSRAFAVRGWPLSLTPREHAVLEVLMTRCGKTVGKQALADSISTIDNDIAPQAIEVYVHRLRKKLEPSDASIINLRGLGYLLKRRDDG
ncbi:MAG: response regulator [Burkholderiaceae bacterium]|nr:response regulator [Burkholderiaceae bacterium]